MNEVTGAGLQAKAGVAVDYVGRPGDHVLVIIVVIHSGSVSRASRSRFEIDEPMIGTIKVPRDIPRVRRHSWDSATVRYWGRAFGRESRSKNTC